MDPISSSDDTDLEALVIDALERVLGAGKVDGALDACPLPADADDHGRSWPSTQVRQPVGGPRGDQRNDRLSGLRMIDHSCVDH